MDLNMLFADPAFPWTETSIHPELRPSPAPDPAAPERSANARHPSAPAISLRVFAEIQDELQRRLGQVVVSTLSEKLGRPAPGDAAGEGATVTADHLRAARALLGWSMSALAQESGLSISTIKRVEGEVPGATARSRRIAVETLCNGGIRFVPLEGGTIAVAKTGRADGRAVASPGDRHTA